VGFDAAKAVEPLDWNFEKFDGGSGTIPEPSERDLQTFTRKFRKLMQAILKEGSRVAKVEQERAKAEETAEEGEEATITLADALAALEDPDMPEETAMMVIDKMSEIVAELAHGSPTLETITGLPSRIRAAFFSWLIQELFVPEVGAVATPPSLRVVAGG
jgi:hypothetical protein